MLKAPIAVATRLLAVGTLGTLTILLIATPTGSNAQQATPPPASPVPATSSPSPTIPIIVAPVTPAKPKYRAGSVITVYQLVDHGKGNYQPGNSIGSFVNYANPWNLHLHHRCV